MKAYTCFILVLVLHYLNASESLAANYTYDNLFGWPQDCNIGMLQSPIDLSRATSTNYCDYNKVRIGFQDGKQQLIAKTGSTSLEMRQHSSIISVVDYDRRVIEYLGESLSFHAPSEHTIDGNRFDLQMHITHNIFKMEPNSHLTAFNKCILALLFRVDNTSVNNTLDKLIDTSSDSLGKITNFDTVFTTLLQNSMLYHYHGSLTTPPCTENVNWYVLERPLPIRTDQLNYIRKYLNSGHDNSRPVQNTNSRLVYRISTECNANMELLSLGSYNFDLKLVLPLLILAVITLI